MKFAYPHVLWLLLFLLGGGFGLFQWSRRVARKKLALFGPPDRLPLLLNSVDHRARDRKFWLVIGALCLVVLAIARPMLPPRSHDGKQTGTEFFIILDVSKSMLVRDVEPNRLEAIKTSLLKWLKSRAGDRIGLILVAGDAFVQAPLTHDLTTLRSVLEQSGPHSISRGGSHIAGAIEAAATALEKSGVKNQVAVLISDGGSTEGQAMEALQKARSNGRFTLFTIGVGTAAGGPVPVPPQKGKSEDFTKPPPGYVMDEYGLRASSRLDERSLRLLASTGGGRYFAFDPDDDVWNRLFTQALQPHARQMDASNLKDYYDLFQLPLLLAIALMIYESALSTRLKNPPRRRLTVTLPEEGAAPTATKMKSRPRPPRQRLPTSLLLVIFLLAPLTGWTKPDLLTAAEAEKWVKEGKAAEAAKRLWDAAQKDPENYYLIYNFGIASYAVGSFSDAVSAFSAAAMSKDQKLHAMALTQLGNAQYRMGQALLKANNPEGSIVSWERAVEYYESSFHERGDPVSKHNLGVAVRDLERVLLETADKALNYATTIPQVEKRVNVLTVALEKYEKAAELNRESKATSEKIQRTRQLLSESLTAQARLNREEAVKISTDPKKDGVRADLNLKASQNYEKAVNLAPENKPLADEYTEFKKTVANEFSDTAEALLKQSADLDTEKPSESNLVKKENILTQAVTRAGQALVFDGKNERAKGLLQKAQTELEKTLEARGDMLKESGDKAAANSEAAEKAGQAAEAAGKDKEAAGREKESANQAQFAAGQFGKAAEDYRKALDLAPENKAVQSKLAEVEGKLATALAKSAEGEIKSAEETMAASPNAPSADKPATADLQKAIGHLEKAVAMLDQSEALAPGKNEVGALAEKANAQLSEKRGQLDKALGKNQTGQEQNTPGKGPEGEAKPGEQKPGESSQPGTPNNPLNFSEIGLHSNEKQGQFIDKTKKTRIRDW